MVICQGPGFGGRMGLVLNRTQILVLGFVVSAWVALGAILVVAPSVYAHALKLDGGSPWLGVAFLAALTGLLVVLGIGVVRRWR